MLIGFGVGLGDRDENLLWFVYFALSVAGVFGICCIVWDDIVPQRLRCITNNDFTHEAQRRAEGILREMLPEEEWESLRSTGFLSVKSRINPEISYHIPQSTSPFFVNVKRNYCPLFSLCLQPQEEIPVIEMILVHKLFIVTDEREYLRISKLWWFDSLGHVSKARVTREVAEKIMGFSFAESS